MNERNYDLKASCLQSCRHQHKKSRTVWAVGLLIFVVIFDVLFVLFTKSPNLPALSLSGTALIYIAGCWVWQDSAKNKVFFPTDIILICFWISFPAYLYESRGFKGICIFLGLFISYLAFVFLLVTITDSIYYSQTQ